MLEADGHGGCTSRQHGASPCRGHEGEILVPEDLADVITSVTGLDGRPLGRRRVRVPRDAAGASSPPTAGAVPPWYTGAQIADLYKFPAGYDGTGQTVAILEIGGGFHQDELDAYFKHFGLDSPAVTVASYEGGGSNSPGSDKKHDREVMCDLEVLGAAAPGARIVMYFAPGATEHDWLTAMSAIVHDKVNEPSIVSISLGDAEENWTAQFLHDFNDVLHSAAAIGVTVCVASGDDGSSDGETDGKAHVDFPASSPYVLACGGTKITSRSPLQEVVWNNGSDGASGGGVSRFFALPHWQNASNVPAAVKPAGPARRGVPDVAGHADPLSGYRLFVDNEWIVYAGTSAVAPLWAALVARLHHARGTPTGFLTPELYALPGTSAFHDITQGKNGDYGAAAGWDPCTGLGSPNGAEIHVGLAEESLLISNSSAARPRRSPPQGLGTPMFQLGRSSNDTSYTIASRFTVAAHTYKLSHVEAAIWLLPEDGPDNKVILSIHDDDNGIPGAVLEHWSINAPVLKYWFTAGPEKGTLVPGEGSHFLATSRARPRLRAGAHYWVSAAMRDAASTARWTALDPGEGVMAFRRDGHGDFWASVQPKALVLSVSGVLAEP